MFTVLRLTLSVLVLTVSASGFAVALQSAIDAEIKDLFGHGDLPQIAKDPITLAATNVNSLQTQVSRTRNPLEPALATVSFVHVGVKDNLTANLGKLEASVRRVRDVRRKILLDGIQRIAISGTRAYAMSDNKRSNLKVESTNVTYNSPKLAEQLGPIPMAVMGTAVVREGEPLK